MSFKKSDVFHVVDTLHNGVVGSWQAFRMGEAFLQRPLKHIYVCRSFPVWSRPGS